MSDANGTTPAVVRSGGRRETETPDRRDGDPSPGAATMADFGDLDGRFAFFAVVTPDGRIPTVDDEEGLNDPAVWYTGPIGTLAHLSDYALVSSDWDDANADFQRHRGKLPEGTKIRAFGVRVEEILNAYEGLEDEPK
jgi:hypothetical protein